MQDKNIFSGDDDGADDENSAYSDYLEDVSDDRGHIVMMLMIKQWWCDLNEMMLKMKVMNSG